jgi:hypothetical protein
MDIKGLTPLDLKKMKFASGLCSVSGEFNIGAQIMFFPEKRKYT